MIGARVGNFQITRQLGEGGMGVVYAATDLASGREVALKSLSQQLMSNQEVRDRFVREAQAMARLQHPNIVQFLGWVDDPQAGWFIAMEFVKGEDLDQILTRMGLVPPAIAVDLILPALDALGYAHSLGVIHRDIKPANIMRLETGVVKMLDFGTAKLLDQNQMTRVGQAVGTSVYMPLEQLMGRPITFAADIYALGVTMYEMITGKLPYYHEKHLELAKILMTTTAVPPSSIYPPTPKPLEAVIMKAMAREPQHRYANAIEFKAALEAIRPSLGASAAAPTGAQAAVAPPRATPINAPLPASAQQQPASRPAPAAAPAAPAAAPAAARAPEPVAVGAGASAGGANMLALGGAIAGFVGVGTGAGLMHMGHGFGIGVLGIFAVLWLATSLMTLKK